MTAAPPLPTPPPGLAETRRSTTGDARGRIGWVLAALLAGCLVAGLASMVFGSVPVPLSETLRVLIGQDPVDPRWSVVISDLRLPRTVTAIAAGAALGVAGMQMQTLFRNPLADPYILGVSSGASLGVAIVVLTAGGAAGAFTAGLAGNGRAGIVVAAAVGAALVLGIILLMARWVSSPVTLLLIGVMLSSGTTAFVSVMLVYSDSLLAQNYLIWSMGSYSATTGSDLLVLLPLIAAGIAVAAFTVRPLNALLLGEAYARSMGIDIVRTRLLIIISAALLAGVTTAYCGPIGFLGLAVPHLARMALGTSDHRWLLPGSILTGALLSLVCGLIAQLPGTDAVLPLGAVTALFGAPVVITVLIRSRRISLGGGR